MVAALPLYDS
jgi:hypothetical protein